MPTRSVSPPSDRGLHAGIWWDQPAKDQRRLRPLLAPAGGGIAPARRCAWVRIGRFRKRPADLTILPNKPHYLSLQYLRGQWLSLLGRGLLAGIEG